MASVKDYKKRLVHLLRVVKFPKQDLLGLPKMCFVFAWCQPQNDEVADQYTGNVTVWNLTFLSSAFTINRPIQLAIDSSDGQYIVFHMLSRDKRIHNEVITFDVCLLGTGRQFIVIFQFSPNTTLIYRSENHCHISCELNLFCIQYISTVARYSSENTIVEASQSARRSDSLFIRNISQKQAFFDQDFWTDMSISFSRWFTTQVMFNYVYWVSLKYFG